MSNGTNEKAGSVDAYLAAVPEPARSALIDLRRVIREAAPEAEEVISYGMPVFKHHGHLVGIAAFKNHCSFFPMSGSQIEAHRNELKTFYTSKGTIRFTPDHPLPADLVRRIVLARVAENERR